MVKFVKFALHSTDAYMYILISFVQLAQAAR